MIDFNPSVYFLIRGNEVVYVGESIQPEYIIKWHNITDFDSYVIVPSNDRHLLELQMIRLIRPIYNKMSITKR